MSMIFVISLNNGIKLTPCVKEIRKHAESASDTSAKPRILISETHIMIVYIPIGAMAT